MECQLLRYPHLLALNIHVLTMVAVNWLAVLLGVIVNGFKSALEEQDIKDDLIVAEFCHVQNQCRLRVGNRNQ
jgi:hypothetical protein